MAMGYLPAYLRIQEQIFKFLLSAAGAAVRLRRSMCNDGDDTSAIVGYEPSQTAVALPLALVALNCVVNMGAPPFVRAGIRCCMRNVNMPLPDVHPGGGIPYPFINCAHCGRASVSRMLSTTGR